MRRKHGATNFVRQVARYPFHRGANPATRTTNPTPSKAAWPVSRCYRRIRSCFRPSLPTLGRSARDRSSSLRAVTASRWQPSAGPCSAQPTARRSIAQRVMARAPRVLANGLEPTWLAALRANLIGNFAIASALHEDPRFYVKKGLSFKQFGEVFRATGYSSLAATQDSM